jgi:CDP-diacylglycerol--glycerol-3-phosphate 3-phosphatidyltransferase
MWDSLPGRIICLLIVGAIEITDILDGYMARKHNQVSDMGKLLDPFADSISRFTVLLSLAMYGYAYLWMIVIIFWRDITVANVRMAALKKGRVVAARTSGKIKAFVQGIGTLLILIGLVTEKILAAAEVQHSIPFLNISLGLMGLITLVTFLSGLDYIRGNWDILKTIEE